MAKWFKYLFAQDGEKTAIPDTTDPTGLVSYQQGYGADYQRVLGTDPLAKAIERNKLNQALNDITGALQQYQTHGFPEYIDATTNGGTAYAYEVGAVVRFSDEKNYRNTVASNTNAPDVSGWVLYNNGADAIVVATGKTTPADSDLLGLVDSADLNKLKKLSWANIKASLTAIFAPIASPAFTGTPTAPTATTGTNTTQLATTAFVNSEISNDVGVANSALVKTALNAGGTAPIYACRAWVNFNGTGTVAIRASGNVSSITDNGVGTYIVNTAIPLYDLNFSAVCSCSDGTSASRTAVPYNFSSSSVYIATRDSSFALFDAANVAVHAIR